MSVLLDLGIFPMDQGASVGAFVAPVVAMIRASGHPYQLGAMGTLVETEDLESALALIGRAHQVLVAQGCRRVYATAKLDMRDGPLGRLEAKVARVSALLGDPTP
ncbi:MAG: MTH1187 family thiamine-binding protein [Chromatiaceae bacterium]|nr:MTH1187 family thiamine-binding protein [Chromatiaceae bacterium]